MYAEGSRPSSDMFATVQLPLDPGGCWWERGRVYTGWRLGMHHRWWTVAAMEMARALLMSFQAPHKSDSAALPGEGARLNPISLSATIAHRKLVKLLQTVNVAA